MMIDRITVPIPWGEGSAHIYAVTTRGGIVLVDSGHDSELVWQALQQGLRDAGRDVSEIRAVLLTHSHGDHMGLAHRLREQFGAAIYVHKSESEAVHRHLGYWRRTYHCAARFLAQHGMPEEAIERYVRAPISRGARAGRDVIPQTNSSTTSSRAGSPIVLLDDGDLLTFDDLSLTAIHCPGHSPGSVVYWHPGSRTLFTGDHILKRVTLSPIIYFEDGDCERRTRSLPDYSESLRKVRDLRALRVLPGHGDEFDDLDGAVDRIVSHHMRRAERVLKALAGESLTAFDILPALFPRLRPQHLSMGVFEIIGHLDILVHDERVVEEKRNGRYYYRAVGHGLPGYPGDKRVGTHHPDPLPFRKGEGGPAADTVVAKGPVPSPAAAREVATTPNGGEGRNSLSCPGALWARRWLG